MKHRMKGILIGLGFLFCATQSRALEVCGLISNGIWRAVDSPVTVTCSLNVADLIIEPGVEVRFVGNYQMTVNGLIHADGTEANPILFKPAAGNSAGWGKIYFEDAIPGSYFNWTIFEGATRSAAHIVRTTVPFSHCTFKNNSTSEYGSAIRTEIAGQDLVISDCSFVGNHADFDGGAIYAIGPTAEGDPALAITDSLFLENNAGRWDSNRSTSGGAIYVQGNSRIQRTTFRENEARAYTIYAHYGVYDLGGALFTSTGFSEITASTFLGNRSNMSCHGYTPDPSYPFGGAIYQNSGSLLLENDLFAENWLNGCRAWYPYGSVLYLNSGTATVINSTFAKNSVRPAIHNNSGTMNIMNSILFWNNSSGAQIAGTATVTYSDVQLGFDGEGNIAYDPIFDSHYRIVAPSRAIDAGNPDPQYNDVSRPPGLGGPRNDMGFTGRPSNGNWLGSDCYADEDHDGYGNPNAFVFMSSCQFGYVEDNTDCDDTKSSVHPGAPEDWASGSCADGLDNNCDGKVDSLDTGCYVALTPTPTTSATSTPIPSVTPVPSPTSAPTPLPCQGDQNGDGQVTIDEIITIVNIALNGCPN